MKNLSAIKTKNNSQKIIICDVFLDNFNLKEVLLKIEEFLKTSSAHQVVTVNAEMVVDAQKDREFLEVINKADLITIDGSGLIWAGKYLSWPLLNIPIIREIEAVLQAIFSLFIFPLFPNFFKDVFKERVAGSDLIWDVCELAAKRGFSVFFLGGGEGIAQLTAEKIKEKYPSLRVAGFYPGSPAETEKIIEMINKSGADILFVAWGAPKQDKWIAKNLKKFKSVKVAIGVGGGFDFIVGKVRYYQGKEERVKRAPLWMQKIGLEWFWRLITQPWRWKRILKAVPYFVFKVIQFKLRMVKNGKSKS